MSTKTAWGGLLLPPSPIENVMKALIMDRCVMGTGRGARRP
jgi:hypothetical protein